jgi:hypothetical protein
MMVPCSSHSLPSAQGTFTENQALGCLTPREVFETSAPDGYVDNASALTTYPQAHHQQQERDSIELEKAL